MITMTMDTAAWVRTVDQAGEKAPIACSRAINRTLTNVRAAMIPVVAADMGLTQAIVRSRVDLRTASPSRLIGTIGAHARPIPLINFGARGPTPSRGTGTGVTARNTGGAGRYPHAFIATVRQGEPAQRYGVFERKGRARLPIRQLYGPSIWFVFGKRIAVGQARAEQMFPVNLAHEVAYAASN